ncbi:hypothetical protein B0H19DRAFT_1134437 [Mycena capillaripes]|nr:hypothetical protein B0H19DRAFT_1134437 [Mycena capillaripes]
MRAEAGAAMLNHFESLSSKARPCSKLLLRIVCRYWNTNTVWFSEDSAPFARFPDSRRLSSPSASTSLVNPAACTLGGQQRYPSLSLFLMLQHPYSISRGRRYLSTSLRFPPRQMRAMRGQRSALPLRVCLVGESLSAGDAMCVRWSPLARCGNNDAGTGRVSSSHLSAAADLESRSLAHAGPTVLPSLTLSWRCASSAA